MSPPSSPHSLSLPPSPTTSHKGDSLREISLADDSRSPLPSILAPEPTNSLPNNPSQPAIHTHPSPVLPVAQQPSSSTATSDASAPPSETSNINRPLPSSVDVDSPCVFPVATASSTPTPTPMAAKTPNLYINGLPPNFPEDELYALTAPYGDVRSVRTFTRHVGDRTSGYGFVLFDAVDSAEKCIEGLKQYRNLHPSFSKQIHKIPGTTYGARFTHSTSSTSVSGASETSCGSLSISGQSQRTEDGSGVSEEDASFKARMERLKDDTSTNLYIEGLPLSIDDATMAALVSPYTVKSSRFFETKLSHPPRIIAFVRLETRAAAEEIIERLHGRMVRGWNDPGSRISVRFADTTEQRELRRAERVVREGDHSPGKLTIAQAALLNLRGQEYQAQIQAGLLPPRHAQHLHLPQLHLNSTLVPGSISSSGSGPGFEVVSQRNSIGGYGHVAGSREHSHLTAGEYHPYTERQIPRRLQHQSARLASRIPLPHSVYSQQEAMTPELGFLLDSQGGGGLPLATNDNISDVEYALQSQLPMSLLGMSQAQARNGYTPAEELILRAHARVSAMRSARAEEANPRKSSAASVDIGMGVRAQRTVASTVAYPERTRVPLTHSPNSPINPLVSMSEDEFHSGASIQNAGYLQLFPADTNTRSARRQEEDIHGLSREFDSILLSQQQQQNTYELQAQAQAHPENQNQHEQIQTHAPHIRATTLPQTSSNSQVGTQHQRHGHYQHSSMSVIDGRRMGPDQTGVQKHNQNSTQNQIQTSTQNQYHDRNQKHGQIHNPKQKRNPTQNQYGKSGGAIFDHNDSTYMHNSTHFIEDGGREQGRDVQAYGSQFALTQSRLAPKFGVAHDTYESIGPLENASPPLVSPALTYSSRTPASLSPATPFFSSFGHAGEGFEGPTVGLEAKKDGSGGDGVNLLSPSGGL